MGRVLVLLVEEGLLVLRVGKGPGNVLVVADEHDRRAREAHARRVVSR